MEQDKDSTSKNFFEHVLIKYNLKNEKIKMRIQSILPVGIKKVQLVNNTITSQNNCIKQNGNNADILSICCKPNVNFTGVSLVVANDTIVSVVEGKLYRGPLPDTQTLNKLAKAGFNYILDLSDESIGERHLAKKLGMGYLRWPIDGGNIQHSLEQIVTCIDKQIANGKKIFVHGFEEQEDTGLVIAYYQLRHGDKKEAINQYTQYGGEIYKELIDDYSTLV